MFDARWPLLRLWHLETTADRPRGPTVTRTSYVSTPPLWRTFPAAELARRVEQILDAHYQTRAAVLASPWDGARMLPFAYDFEWVEHGPNPADPTPSEPWMFQLATRELAEIAFRAIDELRSAPRPGIAGRCYEDAFALFRVDDNDTWRVIRSIERPALFAARDN